MATKLTAAQLAVACGVKTIITLGSSPETVIDILEGKLIGTTFIPKSLPTRWGARKRWVLSLPPRGMIYVDDGAARAITKSKSLFAAGITKVEGEFEADQLARVVSQTTGREIARGLVNYSSVEIDKLKGHSSSEIEMVLGYMNEDTIVARENLALLDS
eukprot:TRINITY_DN6824_c1_g1_i2.p1 TRINITY_DN6824_c1_g1~~TRINITY_DN6824_c1_g1_i2.p1  ORF type:complete len:159 (+),score=49.53 TRINITY_DN6824_c1_g1_i2:98-574(+)